MEIFLRLAAGATLLGAEAAEAVGEGGFGLNLDILDTNLINLSIAIAAVVYLGRKFLGKILSDRTAAIEAQIKEAEQRKQSSRSWHKRKPKLLKFVPRQKMEPSQREKPFW